MTMTGMRADPVMLAALVAALTAPLATAGCTEKSTPTLGTVTGRVLGFGGPPPGRTITPQPGSVALIAGDHRYTTWFGADGRFEIKVPAGSYKIKASAFGTTCQGQVTVRVGSVSNANAECAIP